MLKQVKRSMVIISAMAMMLTGAVSQRCDVKAETEVNKTEIVWGDANDNGDVDIADVTKIMDSLANPNKYKLTPMGKISGDVHENGSGITNADALAIQKFLTHQITCLPESYINGNGVITTITTTDKPTTTTTDAITTTWPKTTTTVAFTSTTTTRPTTTATTSTTTTTTTTTSTTTTTTSTITTATTSTTTTQWSKPIREQLINPFGDMISEETYNILTKTATEMYNITGPYDIIWSNSPVENAFCDPGHFACLKQGMAYGYPVQILKGTEVQNIAPEVSKIKLKMYSKKNYVGCRPIVSLDNTEFNLANFETAKNAIKSVSGYFVVPIDNIIGDGDGDNYQDLMSANSNNEFEFANWYLLPKENIVSYNIKTKDVEPGAHEKYQIPNTQLANVTRAEFGKIERTAKYFNMSGFRIQDNKEGGVPEKYSFVVSGIYSLGNQNEIGYQIISGEDLPKVFNLMNYCLEICKGNQEEANIEYQRIVSEPNWLWTIDKDGKSQIKHYEDYFKINVVMIPLDQNSHDDLKVYNFKINYKKPTLTRVGFLCLTLHALTSIKGPIPKKKIKLNIYYKKKSKL